MFSLKTKKGVELSNAYPPLRNNYSGYSINNKYMNKPPNTSDGRNIISSWTPQDVINKELVKRNGIQSNWQYRQYMIKNADQLRNDMLQNSLNDMGYTIQNINTNFDNVKIYNNINEPITHKQSSLSDLKNNYLTREQLQSQMVVPSLTQAEIIKMTK